MIWVRESNNKFSYQLRAPCEHFKLPPTAPATNFLSGDHINLPLLDITPCTLHPLSHCSKCYILCIFLLPVTHFPLPVFLYFSIFSCIFVLLLTHPTLPWYFDCLYFVFSSYFLLTPLSLDILIFCISSLLITSYSPPLSPDNKCAAPAGATVSQPTTEFTRLGKIPPNAHNWGRNNMSQDHKEKVSAVLDNLGKGCYLSDLEGAWK